MDLFKFVDEITDAGRNEITVIDSWNKPVLERGSLLSGIKSKLYLH